MLWTINMWQVLVSEIQVTFRFVKRRHVSDGMYDKMIQCPVPKACFENYDKILVNCKKIIEETKQRMCLT
jgi:hypothetical protein